MFASWVMGLAVVIINVPHTNCPLLVELFFSILNKKMVVGSIDQLPAMIEEGYLNQLVRPKEMVLALCTSH